MTNIIIGAAISLLSLLVGALLNHHLEKNRGHDDRILTAKLETYGKVLAQLRSSFVSPIDRLENLDQAQTYLSEAALLANRKLSQELKDLGAYIYEYITGPLTAAEMIATYDRTVPDESFQLFKQEVAKKIRVIEPLMKEELNT